MKFADWGEVPYQQALDQQLDLVERVASGESPSTVIFCTHPPVVTLGRQTQPQDVFGWMGETIEVSRGGRATYHGPSQLVIYAICNLKEAKPNRPAQDVRGFLRLFETGLVQSLKQFGIESFGRSEESIDDTGVWVKQSPERLLKVASLGIAVRKWVTYHGAALNISYDPKAFSGIQPCGYTADRMTSVEQLLKALGNEFHKAFVLEKIKASLKTQLDL